MMASEQYPEPANGLYPMHLWHPNHDLWGAGVSQLQSSRVPSREKADKP